MMSGELENRTHDNKYYDYSDRSTDKSKKTLQSLNIWTIKEVR